MKHPELDSIIVAPATPLQVPAPVAVIRVSGPGCWALLDGLFQPAHSGPLIPWRARFGIWCDARGVVDETVITPFRAPASYTGQDMLEISCHGNALYVQGIVQTLLARGARMARPGEYTARALLNGKKSFLEAEAVHHLIHAKTRYQAQLLRQQAHGPLAQRLHQTIQHILDLQAHLEVSIDYGEEDVEAMALSQIHDTLLQLRGQLNALRRTAHTMHAMNRGFRVLITGPRNAGKSSLFNHLLHQERAIVSPLPGTTRDFISESTEIHGLPVTLIDTAGLAETRDPIEAAGIAKVQSLATDVDLLVHLMPPDTERPAEPPDADEVLTVFSKADLKPVSKPNCLSVSTVTGEGVEALKEAMVGRLCEPLKGQDAYLINQRQGEALNQALAALDDALEGVNRGMGEEIISAELSRVRTHLAELIGETHVEQILDRMFSKFCLGK